MQPSYSCRKHYSPSADTGATQVRLISTGHSRRAFGSRSPRVPRRKSTVFAPSMLCSGGLEPAQRPLCTPMRRAQLTTSLGHVFASSSAKMLRKPARSGTARKVWEDAASFCSDPLVACVGWAALLSGVTVLRVAMMDDEKDTPKAFLKQKRRLRKLRQDAAPIVCLGDSITRGNLSSDWVGSLRDELKQGEVLNAGINMQLDRSLLLSSS